MECDHVHTSPFTIASLEDILESLQWICADCRSSDSPWVCLSCGEVRCGRYVNGHAKRHAELHPSHCLCMDQSLQLFCYAHDDFIINETEDIRRIRKHIQKSFRDTEDGELMVPLSKRIKTQSEPSTPHPSRTAGLCNLGNTCFMNAVLQSLSNIAKFSEYLMRSYGLTQLPSKSAPNASRRHHSYNTRSNTDAEEICVVQETATLFRFLWSNGSTGPVSPDSFLSEVWKMVPRFRGYQQQDAHEFLIYLLNQLNSELCCSDGRSKTPAKSIVSELFGGLLQSDVNCSSCQKHSKKLDPIYDISLDIPVTNTSDKCTIYDCLSSYTSQEELSELNWYYCCYCGSKQPSTKKLSFKTLPQVLCVHLKRFKSNRFSRSKISSLVTFPVTGLVMSQYSLQNNSAPHSSEASYDLGSFIMHHGSGVTCGHYTACIHSNRMDKWYHYNDSTVNEVSEEWVKKCKAYILFYVKRPHPNRL